jgi:hypothetical protein
MGKRKSCSRRSSKRSSSSSRKKRVTNYQWDANGNIVYPRGDGTYVTYDDLEDTNASCPKNFIPYDCDSVICKERDTQGKCIKWNKCTDTQIDGLTLSESIKAQKAAAAYKTWLETAKTRKNNYKNNLSNDKWNQNPTNSHVYQKNINAVSDFILGNNSNHSATNVFDNADAGTTSDSSNSASDSTGNNSEFESDKNDSGVLGGLNGSGDDTSDSDKPLNLTIPIKRKKSSYVFQKMNNLLAKKKHDQKKHDQEKREQEKREQEKRQQIRREREQREQEKREQEKRDDGGSLSMVLNGNTRQRNELKTRSLAENLQPRKSQRSTRQPQRLINEF